MTLLASSKPSEDNRIEKFEDAETDISLIASLVAVAGEAAATAAVDDDDDEFSLLTANAAEAAANCLRPRRPDACGWKGGAVNAADAVDECDDDDDNGRIGISNITGKNLEYKVRFFE